MRLNGYAGNGVITLADFNIAPNPVSPLLDSYAPPGAQWLIDVTPFIQSLIDARATHAGFMLENIETIQTAIRSSEDSNPANRPLLTINFTPAPPIPPPAVPLPAALVPGALLGLGVIARRANRKRP